MIPDLIFFQSDDNSMVLQIAPTIYHQCEAMILLLERYNWTDFSILTTKDMGQDFIDCMEKMVEKTSIIQGYLTKPRYVKSLAYDVAVILWITYRHKNRNTARVITIFAFL